MLPELDILRSLDNENTVDTLLVICMQHIVESTK